MKRSSGYNWIGRQFLYFVCGRSRAVVVFGQGEEMEERPRYGWRRSCDDDANLNIIDYNIAAQFQSIKIDRQWCLSIILYSRHPFTTTQYYFTPNYYSHRSDHSMRKIVVRKQKLIFTQIRFLLISAQCRRQHGGHARNERLLVVRTAPARLLLTPPLLGCR